LESGDQIGKRLLPVKVNRVAEPRAMSTIQISEALAGPLATAMRFSSGDMAGATKIGAGSPVVPSQTTRGRLVTRDLTRPAVLPSSTEMEFSAPISVFRSSITQAHRYPYLRFNQHLTMRAARLGAKMDSLSPCS
jgi:hypothetical protein